MHDHVVEVSFTGEASRELCEAFDCLAVVVDGGVTRLHVAAHDPAVLHGIVHQIDAMGLELIAVRTLGTGSPTPG